MTRKYNLASKSDMRRLAEDIERDFKKASKTKLAKNTYNYRMSSLRFQHKCNVGSQHLSLLS